MKSFVSKFLLGVICLSLCALSPVYGTTPPDYSGEDPSSNPNDNDEDDSEEQDCPCEDDEGEGASQSDSSKSQESSLDWMVKIGASPRPLPGQWTKLSRGGIKEGRFMNRQKTFSSSFGSHYKQDPIGLRPVYLSLSSPEVDASLLDPKILELNGDYVLEKILDANGEGLSQIKTDTHLTDIEPLVDGQGDPIGFHIKIWNLAMIQHEKIAGRYVVTPGVDPVQEIIFKEPASGSSPSAGVFKMLVTDIERFGTGADHVYTKLYERIDDGTDDTLTVTTYTGTDETGTAFRKEEIEYLNRGTMTWDYDLTRKVSKIITNADGTYGGLALVSSSYESYDDYSTVDAVPGTPGGQKGARRMAYHIKDYTSNPANGENLRTDYTFYDGVVTPAAGGNPAVYDHLLRGRVKSVLKPDQSWHYYEYQNVENSPISQNIHYSSYKDVPLAQHQNGVKTVTTVLADSYTKETSISGTVISTQKKERLSAQSSNGTTIIKTSRSTGTENAVTISGFNAADGGRPLWVEQADGTAVTYSYEMDGDNLIATKEMGAGDRKGITDGTRTVTTYNASNQIIKVNNFDIASGLAIGSREAFASVDAQNRPMKFFYNGNLSDYSEARYSCCGLEFSRDRSGATTTYFRDVLRRAYRVDTQNSSTGPIVNTTTFFNGLNTKVERTSAVGTLLVGETIRNLAGTNITTFSPDANGDAASESTTAVTTYPVGGGVVTTVTYPDTTTSSRTSFVDGRVKSSTDQEGNITTFDFNLHALEGGGLVKRTTRPGGTQWVDSYQDQLGRTFRVAYADGAHEAQSYFSYTNGPAGSRGRLSQSKDADEVDTAGSGTLVSYSYSADGQDVTTTRSLPNSQQLVSQSISDVVASVVIQGETIAPALRSTSIVNGITISESYRSVDVRTSGSISFENEILSQSTLPSDGSWTTTSTSAVGMQSRSFFSDGKMQATVSFESGATLPGSAPADITTYMATGFISGSSATYDAFGRTLTQTASRTGTTTMGTYLENGSLLSVTDPGARVTSFTYDNMGRRLTVDAPDTLNAAGSTVSNITYTSYTDRGQVQATWGDQTYSRFYQYDRQGRMKELRTYQNLAHGTEPTVNTAGVAATSWSYDSQRGWLTEKNYDGETNNGPGNAADYTYTESGRLATRTWERGVVTTYGYDQGQLASVTYTGETNGHSTPALAYTYDNFGRIDTVKRDNVLHADYGYHATDLVLLTEALNQDAGNPQTLSRTYQDGTNGTVNLRPSGYTFTHGSAIWNYDSAGRFSSVSDGTDTFTYGYHYSVITGGNHLGGATSGSQSWMPVSFDGPQVDTVLEYEATRNSLVSRVNTVGANPALSSFTYSVNAIGQRTGISPGGIAFDTTTAFAWGYNAKGEFIEADRGVGSAFNRSYLYDGIGNRTSSTDNAGTTAYTANAQNQYTAIASLTPTYDLDGNMTAGPVPASPAANATLVWDAENRLVKATVGATVSDYDYDFKSRLVKTTTGSSVLYYLYDGWNRIAEYSGATSPTHQKTNLWGLDLSGSLQGAGGVGGLLSIVETGGTVRYYPAYDGNGNVSEYVNQLGAEVAHFEYDPFGNLTVDDQSNAANFPYRFSTKSQDATTGLYYYGYRYYDPVTGRWLTRDPISERGGMNVYGFVENDCSNEVDVLGLIKVLKKLKLQLCGAFELKLRFNLTNDTVAEKPGYFVQRVTRKKRVYDCDSGDLIHQEDDVYFEAWYIPEGHNYDTVTLNEKNPDQTSDEWFSVSHLDTCGSLSLSGELRFYYKDITGNLGDPGADPPVPPDPDTGFGGINQVPGSGILPSMRSAPFVGIDPDFWKDPPSQNKQPVKTELDLGWNCCDGPQLSVPRNSAFYPKY